MIEHLPGVHKAPHLKVKKVNESNLREPHTSVGCEGSRGAYARGFSLQDSRITHMDGRLQCRWGVNLPARSDSSGEHPREPQIEFGSAMSPRGPCTRVLFPSMALLTSDRIFKRWNLALWVTGGMPMKGTVKLWPLPFSFLVSWL